MSFLSSSEAMVAQRAREPEELDRKLEECKMHWDHVYVS